MHPSAALRRCLMGRPYRSNLCCAIRTADRTPIRAESAVCAVWLRQPVALGNRGRVTHPAVLRAAWRSRGQVSRRWCRPAAPGPAVQQVADGADRTVDGLVVKAVQQSEPAARR